MRRSEYGVSFFIILQHFSQSLLICMRVKEVECIIKRQIKGVFKSQIYYFNQTFLAKEFWNVIICTLQSLLRKTRPCHVFKLTVYYSASSCVIILIYMYYVMLYLYIIKSDWPISDNINKCTYFLLKTDFF